MGINTALPHLSTSLLHHTSYHILFQKDASSLQWCASLLGPSLDGPKFHPPYIMRVDLFSRKAYQHLPCLAPVCGQNQAANCDGVLDRKPRGTLNVCVARLPLKVLEKGSWCRKREEYTLCVCVCGRRSINTESTPRHDASTELESQAIGCHDLLAQ
jgi:hypothetical protein